MLGITMKELKTKPAAQVQLMLGFWWDSIARTRTLEQRKYEAYAAQLLDFSRRRVLTLRDRQQVAGRMQRAVLTLPRGAACYLGNVYAMSRGLKVGAQKRRTTAAERADYATLHTLLQANAGKGYFDVSHLPR